ncbi:Nif11-like leader peptide family natural product precursor [Spirulina sp. CS-785/01]|uniref:Nif11-like leader peptide family natural product precursor n=1 Tax=Spirulina sp. CS-785/01 TaxID=3021716 RepID=UPI00232E06E2|nr:Nif11-like leader peptide family natural product precursor [Spirulina sp. CS-785/01]MDB9316048.1 Nif11-like leader peptide family natural product precursor [Spirulina sp. CS-785/01]
MSRRETIINFFQQVCNNPTLQDKLKSPCPANRHGFAQVANELGYDLTGSDIDDYVRFAEFYEEFQKAIERHQSGEEQLASWLNKWQKHLRRFSQDPLNDHKDTIRRYI